MVIKTEHLTVRFGGRTALNGLTLELPPGVIGVLGPNGAGKSTLLSVVATVTRPSSGSVSVAGHSLSTATGRNAVRNIVGWLPQHFDLASGLTLQDTVMYAAWTNGLDRRACDSAASESLEVVDLTARARTKVGALSGGQRQRLGLACALAHRPQVVLLDEPTSGLDPAQRVRFREYVREAGRQRTVLLATHILDDVQHTCASLVVMADGRAVFSGSVDALAERGAFIHSSHESPLERGYGEVLMSVPRGTTT